ncbi:MAG: nucleotidyltransferase domain-containing protein [Aquificae bacterium]|nr:nucleotidyltransferase domain-containing protein [Aquificota bacterium]
MQKKVRLKEKEIKTIKEAIFKYDPLAEIILFGSRADPSKKGGDIDLLVISRKIGYQQRRKIRVELLKKLGERKIDLLVVKDPKETTFCELAYKYGVRL